MNKNDLAVLAMERHELSRKDAIAMLDALFQDIQDAVTSGDTVKIPGFGQFKVRDRAARMGRNPQTGAPVKIAAKRVFKFMPAKALKDAVMSKRGSRKATPAKKKAAPARKKATAKKSVAKRPAAKKTARKAAKKSRR